MPPMMLAVTLQHQRHILNTSDGYDLVDNAGLDQGDGNNGPSRVRGHNSPEWDEWDRWEEE